MPGPMYDKGLEIRKAVAGADYVEKALSTADEYSQPMQDLVTEYCWGAVWGREGLDLKTRSVINIAMISALNRPQELKTHMRGALRNGCTKKEISEILLQVAVYCGMPAGIDSFRVLREAFAEADKA